MNKHEILMKTKIKKNKKSTVFLKTETNITKTTVIIKKKKKNIV